MACLEKLHCRDIDRVFFTSIFRVPGGSYEKKACNDTLLMISKGSNSAISIHKNSNPLDRWYGAMVSAVYCSERGLGFDFPPQPFSRKSGGHST